MEEAEETMGIGADVQTEGPNTATGLDAIGVLDFIVGIVCMTNTEIGMDGILMFQILQGLAGEHADVAHMGMAGHRPEGAVYITVHGGRAVLIDVVFTQERASGLAGDLNLNAHFRFLLNYS